MHASSKVAEGILYMSKIVTSGVSIKYNTRVLEARGSNVLEEVVIAKTDRDGNIKSGSEKIIKTDSLAIGFGFSPNVELPSLAGCKLEFNRSLGGWIVKVDDEMKTSVENIFSAGEITGVGGALKSINEGRIAAISILKGMEKIKEKDFKKQHMKLLKERKNNLIFSKYFNTLYGIRAKDIDIISDDTVICRCEDVSMGEIRSAVKEGFVTPGALKLSVRAGMGNCQGRTCGPLIYDLLDLSSQDHPKEPFSTRPPVKPVRVKKLVQER
jgi:NAD(P)H-nitrite reductase large subunit